MDLVPQNIWRRRLVPFALGFLTIGLFVFALVTKPKIEETSEKTAKRTARKPAHATHETEKKHKPISPEELKKLSPVEKFVALESLNVGKPDLNPQQSYQRLKVVAKSLRPKDIDRLKFTALNQDNDNDRRFLSVYILTLAETKAAAPALMSIALDPLTIQDISSRLYAEELMIRTQALEGLANYQPSSGRGPLQSYLERQDNAFLADQARRLVRERKKQR